MILIADRIILWAGFRKCLAFLAGLCLSAAQPAQADPFAEHVRSTEPLSPLEQEKTFTLPPGFRIQLFASEPEIGKPMNMAFDGQGRLWITQSREYPYAAPPGQPGRDAIKILEDSTGDGRADRITTFADGLNIPIGMHPYKNGVIAWSIPHIWFFEDTTGDGKADTRTPLYGPLGWESDTHGMNASFRRGFDGWLYITHGFNNTSTARGTDGSEITMHSGNTYRVRLDGSRVEQHTWGQVNPFGLCFDARGNLYSADCHSAPIYQLLRGGYYPSFGKPHDGLGFAPVMMEHSHGSTAISGIVYYEDSLWPEEYHQNTFIGNVMTCRVNRDTVLMKGSTPVAREEPDLVRSTDPWFRPVDLQLGPDGALYIADFYNRIIGHYEVPLDHPGRDRERGRIWRITYHGTEAESKERSWPSINFPAASPMELIEELGSPNLTRRMLAMNELSDRIQTESIPLLRSALKEAASSPPQQVHSLWALSRLGELDSELLETAATHPDGLVRTHAMRILGELQEWNSVHRRLALSGLQDEDPHAQRAASEALGLHPHAAQCSPLLALLEQTPAGDSHLRHVIRLALRNHLQDPAILSSLEVQTLSSQSADAIASVLLAVHTPEAGAFLARYLQGEQKIPRQVNDFVRHAARYVDAENGERLARYASQAFPDDLALQFDLFRAVTHGLAQRGSSISPAIQQWGESLAGGFIQAGANSQIQWGYRPVEGLPVSANPWFLQQRLSADGDSSSWFLSSLPPGGEQLTGILRSRPFNIPARLTFFMAGHDGAPDRPAQQKNGIRLRSAENDQVLAESFPPRNDTAQPFAWELSEFQGASGYLEIVDGDAGHSYAWLAVGRFDPEVVPLPSISPSHFGRLQRSAAELAGRLGLKQFKRELGVMLSAGETEPASRLALAQAILALAPDELLGAAVPLLEDPSLPEPATRTIQSALINGTGLDLTDVGEIASILPARLQTRFSRALAGAPRGLDALLELAEKGRLPNSVLLERSIQERINTVATPLQKERIAHLTEDLPSPDQTAQKLIEQRATSYATARTSVENGATVYAKSCAACHQLSGQGSLIGPQLDGIGSRGLERLLEDILDPNRNIDHAFRSVLITLDDGELVSGLPRREEGELLVLADASGREMEIPRQRIMARREAEISIMPENFDEILTQQELNDLLAFLLAQRGVD
jgi:putative heme-binding domain-containing protein